MADLLIELFSEEIPARMQGKAAADLQKMVTDGLVEAGLTYAGAAAFATPRRLALSVEGLSAESKAVREERRGPSVSAPDKAVEGFMRATGLTKDQLEVRDDKKGQVYFAVIEKPGRAAAEIIAEVLESVVRGFPWPKSMRWGEGTLKWVRPLHTILCILSDEAGTEVVPLEVDGIVAGNTTRGHRFMAPEVFSVSSFEDYEAKLKRAKVVLRPEERAELIWQDATNQAFASGLEVVEDRGLLSEVANLVEWPVVLMGTIAADFLEMPPEVLQTSMKDHQKFFSVKNPKTTRIERFVTVANIETPDNGATILAGNQKVLFARLSDAKFFWENDLRVASAGMEEWVEGLKSVTFHNKLGSQFERVERIVALAREIAPIVGADADEAAAAARVAKADLQSEMIYEFPELQGLMGRYYGEAAGLSAEVAAVAQEHYAPLGPSDDVPTAPLSVTVALADKLDTLTGFWAIDEKPTGSKDPFALRRAALGVIRLVLENELRFDLFSLIRGKSTHPYWPLDLMDFISGRLEQVFRSEGIGHDVIQACLHSDNDRLKDARNAVAEGMSESVLDQPFPETDLFKIAQKAKALQVFLSTDDGENLLQGFKRANNILTQAEEKDGVAYEYGADIKFAEADAEKALFAALDAADAKIAPAMQKEDFSAAMTAMAALRGPIDAFFTDVQVNADSAIVRRNRLNLLSRIRTVCLSVADLTRIDG